MENRKDNDPTVQRQKDTRTYEVQDNEGHMKGSNLSTFNEQQAQERQQKEDDSELNKEDARGGVTGTDQGSI